MKKILLALSLLLVYKIQAQVNITQRTCGTAILPASFETWLKSVTPVPGKYGSANVQSVFNIPVIVHVVHDNESVNTISATSGNNINAAQVINQLNILNKDYKGLNADTNLIPSVFKAILGRFQVNFCLAVVNPTGGILAEPGIDRVNRVSKGWSTPPYTSAYTDATIKPNSIWNTNMYLNIWVLPLSGGLLGYATFPNPGTSGLSGLTGTYGSATTDGVVILNTAFGSIGTAQAGAYNKGRTATHEIGHWIGLRHIWGDANCGTDYCNDTPPAQNSNFGCPTFPYKLGTCSGNTTGEMTMNFMDYTDDACMLMFTADQKYRAQLILTNSTMRAALITSSVCNLPTVGNDVGISFVSQPTYSQTINCLNYINPVVNISNYGSTLLTAALFTYKVDGINTQTLSWTGSIAPNASSLITLPQIAVVGFGTHVFSVNVTSPNGGTDNNLSNNNSTQYFTVANSFAFTPPSASICQGNSIVLTAVGATSYSWSTGANTASVSLSPLTTSVYTVTAFYGLCSVSKISTVTVQTPPIITLNKTHVCPGMPTVITAAGANSYSWSNGVTASSNPVTLTAPTIYTVTGYSTAGCAGKAVYTISIDPSPNAMAIASHASCGTCNDATLSVTASGGTAPYQYNWMPGNNATQTVAGSEVGCYTVTITDALGCEVVDSTCVSFDTGIFTQTATSSFITLWPNPSTGKFFITIKRSGNKKIEILDPLGKLIQTNETALDIASIDLSSYANGVYYVRVSSDTDFSILKLIKK